ncbi:hypothetical protein FLAPJACK_278 [Bacillus phage Flapjack]|uniref:Uncharacterized protein n=1 Tax=Bacillus phage Flapjack TaxID=1983465 RepID=A0A1X9SGK1_9CAUD|nr:hypothetical protein FLAPJACK_278 [Bacillus phage Flapjack]
MNRIDVNETTCVHVDSKHNMVKINQLNPLAKDGYDYKAIYLSRKEIIELAEQLKEEQKNG